MIEKYDDSLNSASFAEVESIARGLVVDSLEMLGRNNDFTVEITGGSNSTEPDIKVSGVNIEPFYFEVKKDPPAAGFQGTLKFNNKLNDWDFNTRDIQDGFKGIIVDNAFKMLSMFSENDNTTYSIELDLDDGSSNDFLDLLSRKFSGSDTRGFISMREDGRKYLFNPKSVDDLREYMNPRVVIRPKYSGSSVLYATHVDVVNSILKPFSVVVDTRFDRKGREVCYVKNLSDFSYQDIKDINKTIDTRSRRDNATGVKSGEIIPYISSDGEVRKLSETMSMTVVVSLRLRDDAPMTTRDDFVSYIEKVVENL